MNPQPTEEAPAKRIRRLARSQNLVAQKSRRNGLWYVADLDNRLLTWEHGLDEQEALEWLLQPEEEAGPCPKEAAP